MSVRERKRERERDRKRERERERSGFSVYAVGIQGSGIERY